MRVTTATSGAMVFDVNQVLTADQYKAFKDDGFAGVVRYAPRTSELQAGNIDQSEMEAILDAGLSLMVVQHAPEPNWHPSAELGQSYGGYAVEYLTNQKIPTGINVWLDLEMVASGTPTSDIIAYCQAWFTAVQSGGYVPGLYVGYQCGLTADQLYIYLSFVHYWCAYNGGNVSTRGFQMLQHDQKSLNGIFYDPDTIQKDKEGGLPIWLAP